MSYRTVIAYIRSTQELQRIFKALALLAQDGEPMHVTGLYVIPTPVIYSDASGFIDASFYEGHLKYHQKNAENVAHFFQEQIARYATTFEFLIVRSESDNASQTVNEFGMAADLILAGQADPDDPDTQITPLDQLVYNTKTPTLIVPYNFHPPRSIRKLAIAFNGKYEASSAAFDAMPLARHCATVSIVWVNAPKPESEEAATTVIPARPHDPNAPREAPEIARRLQQAYQRHDITATIDLIPSEGQTVQDRLRHYVEENEIDVLIMGAYSQSRLKELIFGGVTRSFLANMPCMTLFSR
ncbi:universal stress protein [Pseudochrobactrum sp. sp1633]|uniref:universal stress protein n=1 Tax=Pseudochrobactrum sp. sp1633 TaxID=3036706 RepID=UPI0025A656F2|nr:universal stress protein [Pseudochrobactrum sp. sp1633]MDM8344123.1 universal stress protein [Pseudochrobactrum sp. sp1633]HWD12097.1 universal stress protein [Pseudochrobactrum sp.]